MATSAQIAAGVNGARLITATISSGQSLSEEINLAEFRLVGIQLPSNISSATALTFQAGGASGALDNMYTNAGVELNYTVAASRFIVIDPAHFIGVPFLKIRTGTSGSPTPQGADRTITLICHGL